MSFASAVYVAAFFVWLVASSVWTFPHNLSYFNEAVGGPVHGSDHLLGSCVEWRQDFRAALEHISSEMGRNAAIVSRSHDHQVASLYDVKVVDFDAYILAARARDSKLLPRVALISVNDLGRAVAEVKDRTVFEEQFTVRAAGFSYGYRQIATTAKKKTQ